MPENTIHPSGEKIKKALKEFSELLRNKPAIERRKLLERVAIQFDLSPNECAFLERHFEKE